VPAALQEQGAAGADLADVWVVEQRVSSSSHAEQWCSSESASQHCVFISLQATAQHTPSARCSAAAEWSSGWAALVLCRLAADIRLAPAASCHLLLHCCSLQCWLPCTLAALLLACVSCKVCSLPYCWVPDDAQETYHVACSCDVMLPAACLLLLPVLGQLAEIWGQHLSSSASSGGPRAPQQHGRPADIPNGRGHSDAAADAGHRGADGLQPLTSSKRSALRTTCRLAVLFTARPNLSPAVQPDHSMFVWQAGSMCSTELHVT